MTVAAAFPELEASKRPTKLEKKSGARSCPPGVFHANSFTKAAKCPNPGTDLSAVANRLC